LCALGVFDGDGHGLDYPIRHKVMFSQPIRTDCRT
jgi:hypothetical protein